MEKLLNAWGIPNYCIPITSTIPVQATAEIDISKTMPEDVGWIYGMSIDTDTVDPANRPLISTGEAQNMYLKLKHGSTEFYSPVRLDKFIQPSFLVPAYFGKAYLPISIPGDFDFSASKYINPTGIVSSSDPAAPPKVINLFLWHITKIDYHFLLNKGMLLRRGAHVTVEQGAFKMVTQDQHRERARTFKGE